MGLTSNPVGLCSLKSVLMRVWFTINYMLYCPFSLQAISQYNVFEQGLITALLWRLRASHNLTVKKVVRERHYENTPEFSP